MSAERRNPALEPFVSTEWLRKNAHRVVICDTRAYLDDRDGRAAFDAGHIAEARFLDLETELSTTGDPTLGRHPLPAPADFAAVLGSAGIGIDTPVVAYDDGGGRIAARLVWMLRVLGQSAAILDGGIEAWPGELTTETQPVNSVQTTSRPWPMDAIADAVTVEAHIAAGGVVVDSRAAIRYRGEMEPIDPKAGHIPGAINLPFSENLISDRTRSTEELRQRFTNASVDKHAIFYCGSGVTACHNILAAEAAGIERPRLYVGSWSGWSAQDRPVAIDA